MVNFLILAGGYSSFGVTTGIITYLFNSDASSLSVQSTLNFAGSPSWLFRHPTNTSVLYATNENWPNGQVQSFTIGANGVLKGPIDTIDSGGQSPAHALRLSSGKVVVMNYSSGNGRLISTTPDGLRFDPATQQTVTFPVSGSAVSHPHQVVEYQGEVLIPDLGLDRTWRLSPSGQIQGYLEQPKGSGPRHLAIADGRLYTLNELASTLSMQLMPTSPNVTTPIIKTVSTLPTTKPAGAKYGAAEILIPPATSKFPKRYIYVSNRNTGTTLPEGDTIAIFEATNDNLVLVKQVPTGVNQPRGMEIGPVANGGDEFLVVAGVAGQGGVVVFRRTDGGRNLVEVARNKQIQQRSGFVWL